MEHYVGHIYMHTSGGAMMSLVVKVSSAALQAAFVVRPFFDLLPDIGMVAAGTELLGLRFLVLFVPVLVLEAFTH